ncbi:MAG: SAM-dependent chlorinase/fluorinase [Egibacteraceae bacterium]
MPGAHATITFLSDYGLADPFVGVCHAVMARIAPHARVVDLTHGVARHDVTGGATALADCAPYLPRGVHLAVVDPGVGTDRRAVALTAGGHVLVGPDNGLLLPAAERLGGVDGAWELVTPAYRLEPLSATFHGRDVFAPAAAHLARGVPPAELGPGRDPVGLVRLDLPGATQGDGRLQATVVGVDGFGNVALSALGEDLAEVGMEAGDTVAVEVGAGSTTATVATAFAEVPDDVLVLLVDSTGRAALAVNGGDAASLLGAHPGAAVAVTRTPRATR